MPKIGGDRQGKRAQKPAGPGFRRLQIERIKRQLGRRNSARRPILQTSGEDSRDDSRAGQRTGAAGARSDQGDHHPDVREGRHRGVEAPAGADRLLGAMVRPLPAADADHREGGPRRQGQGQAGQDEHRRASGDTGPDGHPVDPGRDRLRQRPARRRFHGRGSGKPGQRLHRQADRGHAGAGEPNIAEILKEAEAVLAEGDPAAAAQIYAEVLAADATNIAGACGTGEMLRGDRRHRTGQADARDGAGIEAQ